MTAATQPRTSPADAGPTALGPVPSTLVACPDARPPAYQAAIGLAGGNSLDRLVTGFYYGGHGRASELARQFVPCQFARIRRTLRKRHDPADTGRAGPVGLGIRPRARGREQALPTRWPSAQHAVARWRTRHFDRVVAHAEVERQRPEAALIFSDVGSEFALPTCRELGVPSVLSMVHGDVREEQVVLDREAAESPDFFPIYLGDGRLDLDALDWLHARRLRDIALADRVLVPSEHIAATLACQGTPRDRISVIPYAADSQRFATPGRPSGTARGASSCSRGGSPSGRGSSISSKPGA